jgi:hypothetical protein
MYPNQYCHQCNEPEPCVELPAPPDCTGEPCEEIVLDTCVRYTGPAIPCLGITTGANLNQVLQIIANRLCDCCDGTPPVVNCVVSEWSAWSTCVNGVQTRTRTVTQQPQNGGTPCPPLTETRECCNPVNCVVSEWGPWTDCVGGVKTRARTVTTPASCGGTACPPLEETVECTSCNPITNIFGRSLVCASLEVSFSDDGTATSLVAELVSSSSPTVVLQTQTFTPTGTSSSYMYNFGGVAPGTYIVKVTKNSVGGLCDVVTTLPVTVIACPTPCPAPEFSITNVDCDAFVADVAHIPSNPNVTLEYQVAGSANWTAGGMLTTTLSGPNTITVSGLTQLTNYNVRIKTKCSGGDSTWVTASTTTLECVSECPPPTGLTYEEVCTRTENGITATASVSDPTALSIQFTLVHVTGGNTDVDTQIISIPGGGSASADFFGLGLIAGDTYKVKAKTLCESFGESTTVEVSFVKNACRPAEDCPAPTNLTATVS